MESSNRIGNRVLIMDENTRQGKWLTGTMTKLFPGDDGRIRSVYVKTATSELTRPIVKVCRIRNRPGGTVVHWHR